MIAAALFGALLWWRGTLFETRWYLRIVAQTWWLGFVAVIAGWVVTESGRQPWIVHGHPAHRRRDLAGARPRASRRRSSLFVVVYGIVFAIGIYYINRLIAQGPAAASAIEPPDGVAGAPAVGRADAARERRAGGSSHGMVSAR